MSRVLQIIFGVFFAMVGFGAQAGGSAQVVCGSDSMPILMVSYSTGADAGSPGLFWFGVLSADQTRGAAMTENGWVTYSGGMYPFWSRYDAGMPGAISRTIRFPGNSYTTSDYVGYSVYAGHGAYSNAARAKVADRRASLNRVKNALVAAGTWNAEYDSDDRYIWSLIQKDMIDGGKAGSILTVPFVDCTPKYD